MHPLSTSSAGRFLERHLATTLGLLILVAFAAAVPPNRTFGSHNLEQIKDGLALTLVAFGLALRFAASGFRFDRQTVQSPFYAANLLILFGIFLMHGSFYVLAIGAVACAAIFVLLRTTPHVSLLSSLRPVLRNEAQFDFRAALAREWPILSASICLLALTEAYEEVGATAPDSLARLIVAASGAAALTGFVALLVQLRHETAGPFRLSREAADAILLPWARRFFWLGAFVLQLRRPYHSPAIAAGRTGKRENDTRWPAVAAEIEACHAQSILDIGCAEGWFLRRAADSYGCFGLGVDSYESRVMLGEAARLYRGDERVAIMKGKLTAADIRVLPRFDIVMCLSVLHWVIRAEGLAVAQDFIGALLSRTGKVLLFEIGEADLFARQFRALLPEDANGEDFVRHLLESAGASNVRVVARSRDINDEKTRLLFAAEPPTSQGTAKAAPAAR